MTKIKIQIKNRWNDSILFEYEKEDNTIKDTLIEAVKSSTSLRSADLHFADFSGAYLSGAYLSGANLSGANLSGADLRNAYLSGADLRSADINSANLSGADLRGADLRGADLRGAYLSGTNLRGAYLSGANLSGANLSGAKDIPYIPIACPSDGAFIGWKKVRDCLIQLLIPEDAKRCSATGNKCRCEFAKVLAITDMYEKNPISEILNSSQQSKLLYKVGEMVYPDSFDDDRWNECSHGIHFFINKQDAINY